MILVGCKLICIYFDLIRDRSEQVLVEDNGKLTKTQSEQPPKISYKLRPTTLPRLIRSKHVPLISGNQAANAKQLLISEIVEAIIHLTQL